MAGAQDHERMNAPTYNEYAPAAALAPFVHCIWTFTAPSDETPQRIAPDGRPELIVHYRKPYRERGATRDVVQPPVLFAGQLTRPLTLVAQGDAAVIGVRFHAFATRAFLGIDASAATDRRLDLASLHGDAAVNLRSDVREQDDLRRCISIVETYVQGRFERAEIDVDVRRATQAVMEHRQPVAPADISERQWQRRFKREVGVSPRMLQTIVRFRSVFDAIEHPQTTGWVEASLAAGYFDQPQMARDFRRFLGCTAREWAAQKAGLATALTGG
ncbi:transcriptional regulator of AraC family [alpha proteobacterium U9-1i]|nr:transcriptional regulator of AraC family [alpha proteobacterium U9-1i]